MKLKSLAGVERLRWLEYLYAGSNDISELDVSSNLKLVCLEVQNNSLKYGDFSALTRL